MPDGLYDTTASRRAEKQSEAMRGSPLSHPVRTPFSPSSNWLAFIPILVTGKCSVREYRGKGRGGVAIEAEFARA